MNDPGYSHMIQAGYCFPLTVLCACVLQMCATALRACVLRLYGAREQVLRVCMMYTYVRACVCAIYLEVQQARASVHITTLTAE